MRQDVSSQVVRRWPLEAPLKNVNEVKEPVAEQPTMAAHSDAVEAHHRFGSVHYKGAPWDLTHLEAFPLRIDPGLGFEIDVIVLFSCHCFSHAVDHDDRLAAEIPRDELFENTRERRVLNEERYRLSRQFLPSLIRDLPNRKIQVSRSTPQNFVVLEIADPSQTSKYAVFFNVEKDKRRSKRILLRVQSAYLLETITQRQKQAGKVNFDVLIRAAHEGRKIRS